MMKYLTDISHILYGIIGSLTGNTLEFTIIYITYQVFDFLLERNIEELKEDIIEYAIGITIGAVVKTLFSILF